jgi:hypothetical protein
MSWAIFLMIPARIRQLRIFMMPELASKDAKVLLAGRGK